MKKERIDKNTKELDEVIDTSKIIRNYMLDKNIPYEERSREIKTMRTAVEANKSIVSSVINQIVLDRLANE